MSTQQTCHRKPLITIATKNGKQGDNKNYQIPEIDKTTENGCHIFEPVNYTGKVFRDIAQFADNLADYGVEQYDRTLALVMDKTIAQLQQLMNEKQLTSLELVKCYLYRARLYDVDGLNSIIEFNPDIITDAIAADTQREQHGQAGLSLLGIPVGLKDNVATADKLHTATGSAAMLAWEPSRDAFLVQQLRVQGALIFGKLNQGEWANFTDWRAPNGFSNNGGQTYNPYGLYTTWGSSSGSAVAVAADLMPIAIGSETSGSVLAPAFVNGVIGLKSTRGLISRDYVIPLDVAQDSMGIMGQTIDDVATTMTIVAAIDDNDPYGASCCAAAGWNYQAGLTLAARQSLVVGVEADSSETHDNVHGANHTGQAQLSPSPMQQALFDALKKGGVQVKFVAKFNSVFGDHIADNYFKAPNDLLTILPPGFRDSVNDFLKTLGEEAPFANLDEIIAFNEADPTARMVFGHKWLLDSVADTHTREQSNEIHAFREKVSREIFKKFFIEQQISVLATENIYDDLYSPAGYPALTVPFGRRETTDEMNGMPIGISFMGEHLSDGALLTAGKALELGVKGTKYQLQKPNIEARLSYLTSQSSQA
ncbi:amidase family protein [Shewanella intestini]|uniref:Amidase domain-containing protein n=1 Tax=Shewanella intestini TaxID=2017544 RepID=A0ABS5I350_9GAMM|nr:MULTISPECIES: amidase family protein [Shewanella]MBR9728441.1 hypothetical protein [Shewanella intestini]MRG36783.1 hypothetical protein [Shewanella sp. XMDDZSB0408]